MKKAFNDFINGIRLFFQEEFCWSDTLTPEFIKDIIGGFLLGVILIALLFMGAILS